MAIKMHADARTILHVHWCSSLKKVKMKLNQDSHHYMILQKGLSIRLLEKVYVWVCVVPYLTLGKDLRLWLSLPPEGQSLHVQCGLMWSWAEWENRFLRFYNRAPTVIGPVAHILLDHSYDQHGLKGPWTVKNVISQSSETRCEPLCVILDYRSG